MKLLNAALKPYDVQIYEVFIQDKYSYYSIKGLSYGKVRISAVEAYSRLEKVFVVTHQLGHFHSQFYVVNIWFSQIIAILKILSFMSKMHL